MRCIVRWDLSLIMASYFLKELRCFKRIYFVLNALAITGVNPFRESGVVLWFAILLLFTQLSRFLIPVPMTDSLFVSLCKRGCPYFHMGSLVHRWQVVFGSALLHRVHFGSWRGWLHRDDFDIFRHYCTYIMIPPLAMQTDLLSVLIIVCICTAFGDVDWYPYYVSLHVCIPPLAMMTDHFPFIY